MEYEYFEVRKTKSGTEDFLIEAGRANDEPEAIRLFVNTLKAENDVETYDKLRKQDASLKVSYVLKDYRTKEVLMTVELNGEKLVNAETGAVL